MHKKDYYYSESEKAINKVLVAQDKTITSVESTLNENDQKLNESIRLAEDTLKSIGMGKEVVIEKNEIRNLPSEKKIYILRNWDSILEETEKRINVDVMINSQQIVKMVVLQKTAALKIIAVTAVANALWAV